jgi:hypothetical protein
MQRDPSPYGGSIDIPNSFVAKRFESLRDARASGRSSPRQVNTDSLSLFPISRILVSISLAVGTVLKAAMGSNQGKQIGTGDVTDSHGAPEV